jgi:hypothetical protein
MRVTSLVKHKREKEGSSWPSHLARIPNVVKGVSEKTKFTIFGIIVLPHVHLVVMPTISILHNCLRLDLDTTILVGASDDAQAFKFVCRL